MGGKNAFPTMALLSSKELKVFVCRASLSIVILPCCLLLLLDFNCLLLSFYFLLPCSFNILWERSASRTSATKTLSSTNAREPKCKAVPSKSQLGQLDVSIGRFLFQNRETRIKSVLYDHDGVQEDRSKCLQRVRASALPLFFILHKSSRLCSNSLQSVLISRNSFSNSHSVSWDQHLQKGGLQILIVVSHSSNAAHTNVTEQETRYQAVTLYSTLQNDLRLVRRTLVPYLARDVNKGTFPVVG